MKRSVTFLQFVVVLIGIGILAFLLIEPHLEGVNQNATVFQMYFQDPFIAFIYISSLPFFAILFQTYKILGSMKKTETPPTKAFKIIKNCCLMIIPFAFGGAIWIMLNESSDDKPPAFMLATLITLFFLTVRFFANKLMLKISFKKI